MSDKKKILIQLDSDTHPSVFDRVVAVDAGADEVFSYGGVTPENVRDLVFGAIFTRGPADLHRTAIFIGGGDVAAGERLLESVRRSFIGGLRVSLMLDSSGANTTAAAAVKAVVRHVEPRGARALVLGGTGSVGRRVVRLLARLGVEVRLGSRRLERAAEVREAIVSGGDGGGEWTVEAMKIGDQDELDRAVEGASVLVAAGGAGVKLTSLSRLASRGGIRLAVDLNAVPPLGIEGIEVGDQGVERHGIVCYGAIGVGGAKMKIHRAAVAALFERNDRVLDAEAIFDLGSGSG